MLVFNVQFQIFKELQRNMSNIKHQKGKLNKTYWHLKAYIYDRLTSSVNGVKCSTAAVSEFMNKL